MEKAIEFEVERQIELLEGGGKVVQETRLYDSDKDVTRSMRSKEEAMDYRYFPDPDLLEARMWALGLEGVTQMAETETASRRAGEWAAAPILGRMLVHLCRHAEAAPGDPDHLRPLTPAGVVGAETLAQRTAGSTREIEALISAIQAASSAATFFQSNCGRWRAMSWPSAAPGRSP